MDYKLPKRKEISNKSTYGKVLNIAGSDYMPGAAYLSSISALKIGCGYCFLLSGERVINSVASKTSNVVFAPYSQLNQHLKNSDVVSIGCGLSTNYNAEKLFLKVIKNVDDNKKLVIDADGINLLAKHQEKFKKLRLKNFVLTPHPKEAQRLLGFAEISDIVSNSEFYARKISEEYGCVTVLKTHKTVVTAPDGKFYKNTTGNNSMAKAGSGDVLTGMISGLIAQGMDIFEASCLGVYLHGLCGDLAKEDLSSYCVMADDLISYIPKAIKIFQN